MATYNKKKRSILPSFSSLRDSVATPKSKKERQYVNKRGLSSSVSTPAINQSDSRHTIPSQHDDTIDELVSMLLEDTILEEDEPKVEPNKCLPCLSSAQTIASFSGSAAHSNKSLPQLPKLLFNGDDVWARKAAPVVTAAGVCNEASFKEEYKGISSLATHFVHHVRQGSGPPVPRKSSKRQSTRARNDIAQVPLGSETDMMDISEKEDAGGRPSSAATGVEINKKIEAVMAATEALKSPQKMNNSPLRGEGPFVPSKKRRLKDNKVLVKMKAAINERFIGLGARKRRDSLHDGLLLDNSINEMPDCDDEGVSLMEIRMNEGANLKNPKIKTVTGHGYIPRKSIADDGRSLRSKKSLETPSSRRSHPNDSTRIPMSFGNRSNDGSSSNQEIMPDLPSHIPISRRSLAQPKKFQSSSSFETGDSRSSLHTSDISELPSRVQTPKNHLRRAKKTANLNYEADLDALFSSSPLGHSTPRIRLEPTEDDGRRMLRSVPAESRSIFDSDMDLGADPIAVDSRMNPRVSNRMKKHPSPSKRELEDLEEALSQFDVFPEPVIDTSRVRNAPREFNHRLAPTSVLGKGDANAAIQGNKVQVQGKCMAQKSAMTRSADSVPLIPCSRPQKAVPKHEKADSRRYSIQNDDSMEIDELQWDDSQYNIGMKRV